MASASLYIIASTYFDVIANAKTRALTPNTNIMHIAHKFSLSLRERKKQHQELEIAHSVCGTTCK